MGSSHASPQLLDCLRYAYPAVTLLVFIVSSIITLSLAARNTGKYGSVVRYGPRGKPLPKRLRSTMDKIRGSQSKFSHRMRFIFAWLAAGVLGTFVADAAIHITHVMVAKPEKWWCSQAVVIYVVGSFFSHAIIMLSLLDTNPSPTFAQFAPWSIAIPFEFAIVLTALSRYTNPHNEPVVGDPSGGYLQQSITSWESLEVASACIRIFILTLLVTIYLFHFIHMKTCKAARYADHPDETTRLLDPSSCESGEEGPWNQPMTTTTTSWREFLTGYSLLFPYLWPSKSRRLQIVVIICFVLLILQRAVIVLVPFQVGMITNAMSVHEDQIQVPWFEICMYIIYRWLQGSQGLVESVRANLWIPISQQTYMEVSTAAFEHVHNISLDSHLDKKMSEVLSALGKGGAINTFLEQVTFQMLPMLIDLGVAVGYFLVAFGVYYGLVLVVFVFCSLYVTVRIAQWRTEMQRRMDDASRQKDAVRNGSLASHETVKYFNAEGHEFSRYRNTVTDLQEAEHHSISAQNIMNMAQNTIFMLCLLITCFIAAHQVSTSQCPVGHFITLLTYMAQLQTSLSSFGTSYQHTQTALVNSEHLLELFREQPSVVDRPSAAPLAVCQGRITFNNIGFSYDPQKPVLDGVAFNCKPGTTTALVSEPGGGKTTILRLLFRFYNAQRGNILIDGNDIQDITISSLRRHVGIIPRNAALFKNESIMYNLKYANQSATDEEVHNACRAASIHDKIMTFPAGYETRVGDQNPRGLHAALSSSEKQRIAIAQTILKNPQIILLDEVTAALDSEPEQQQHVQKALANLSRGRTVLVIAHRLSAITKADNIVVLHDGQVAESGTHERLLAIKGRYAGLWQKQARQNAAGAAKNDASAQQAKQRKVLYRHSRG